MAFAYDPDLAVRASVFGGIAQHVADHLFDVGLFGEHDRVRPLRLQPEADSRPPSALLVDDASKDVVEAHRLTDRIEHAALGSAQDDEVADDAIESRGLRRDVAEQFLAPLIVAGIG